MAKKPPTLASELKAAAASSSGAAGGSGSIFKYDEVTLLFMSLKVMPDLDEVLRKAGLSRASLKKLTYDDDIFQAIDTRREAAINVPWRLEGGTKEQCDFLAEQITARAETIFGGCWNSRLYGYSVVQTVYGEAISNLSTQRRYTVAWASEMPIEFYFPQRDGTVMYRPQTVGEPVPIIPEKYLVPVINPTYMNPYGEALLSRLYWLWFFRTNGWNFWMQWLENFGTPFLVGKTPNTITDPVKNTRAVDWLAAQLDKVRRGSAIAIDSGSEVTAIEMKGTGQQFTGLEDAVTKQIAKVVLGQTLTSSEGRHGTQALGSVHEQVRQDKKRADVRVLMRCGQLLVDRLCMLNGWADVPKFMMEDARGLQKERAERDASLVDKGVLVFTREYLEETYEFEPGHIHAPGEPGYQDAKGTPVDQNAAGATDANGHPVKKPVKPDKKKMTAELRAMLFKRDGRPAFTPEQEVIEAGVEELAAALTMGAVDHNDILQAIRESTDPDDLSRRLAVVLQDEDSHQFTATLNAALSVARLTGYVQAAERSGAID